MATRIPTFAEFWPFYLSQHASVLNRRLHFVGTTGTNIAILSAILTMNPWLLILAPLSGYAFAWVGHFIIEKNRPATFTYPLWSLAGDYRMYGLMLVGKLDPELVRAGVTPASSNAAQPTA